MKKKFCLYTDLLAKLGNMSNEELGELFRAILSYVNGGEVSITSPAVNVAFSFVKIDLDAFQAEYEERCRKNSENIKKRWQKAEPIQSNTNEYERIPTNTKHTDRIGKDRIGNINNTYMVKSFNEFWSAYPKKVARKSAEKVWEKLKPNKEMVAAMLSAINKQKKTDAWRKDGGQFIPHPATWLNGRRWEDEVSTKSRGYQGNDTSTEDIMKGLSYEQL